MRRRFTTSKAAPVPVYDLEGGLAAVRTILAEGEGRLPAEDVEAARSFHERAGERLALGAELTVVALAGATGSGKSSMFNALAGSELSQVGVRRPTTSVTSAAVWGDVEADALLAWLKVDKRHRIAVEELRGLVLLDLPDHDSTEEAHREEVDRLVERVDVFVWVVDPQKYADALLHERYLRPLASHAPVTVVLLNQIDRLSPDERRTCMTDLQRLLEEDGLDHVNLLATSTRTGLGLPELRALISARVELQSDSAERLSADAHAVLERFRPYCNGTKSPSVSGSQRADLVAAMADAAGAGLVADTVALSHKRQAVLVVGWPFTRWLRRFRPDPLARLHLGPGSGGGRTSRRPPTNVQRAEVENAVRTTAAAASRGMAEPWPQVIRAASPPPDELEDDLDRAVSRADLGANAPPRWWGVIGALQKLFALAALVGFLWLTVLFVLQWLQVPRPPTPELESLPWPTLLLIGGLLGGLLTAWIARWFVRAGAVRRRRRAYDAIAKEVDAVAEARVLMPIEREQRAYSEICEVITGVRS